MSKDAFDRTRRLLTLGLIAAGVGAPSIARAQFNLGDVSKIASLANSLKGLSIDEDDELSMGQSLYGPLIADSGGIYRNSSVQTAVARIAAPIFDLSERSRFSWEIAVIDSNEVNAWSLPGGKIGVNKGLLRYVATEDELAAVLAHEAGHAELSHVAREMKKSAFYSGVSGAASAVAVEAINNNNIDTAIGALKGPMKKLVTSGYSRGSEDEADQHIIKMFGATNHNVHAGVKFFNTLLELVPVKSKRTTSLFSGHPATKKRIARILKAAPAEEGEAPTPATTDFGDVKEAFPTRLIYLRRPA